MNFDEPSPRSVDAANGFMVEQVKKTPPSGIGLTVHTYQKKTLLMIILAKRGQGKKLVVERNSIVK